MWGTPDACPVGFEVLFDYKKNLRDFKTNFNGGIPEDDRGTVTEFVISAEGKPRAVDRSLCVKDLPPCPVSVFQAGRDPPVYMADPADPLFEHRGLDANFVARSQHVVDFGAGFNAAWEAQTEADGMGYRLSANLKYWRVPAPGRTEVFTNADADVGDHEPFEDMHPDRCVDAVAEPDPPVVPSDYSECEALKPEIIDPGDGAPSHLPYAKDAFVFETTADPAVSMCVRFARKACPPGTLLTDVAQRFTPAAESGTDTEDSDAVDPGYVVEPVGEVEVQRRCRSLVRRTWKCPKDEDGKDYEPLNQFNRCSLPPPPPAAGQSEAPCLETEGTLAREEAFEGFFGAVGCDGYVRGNFAADPAACSTFGFADPGDAGIAERDNPYSRVINYLGREHTTVLTEVDAGVEHWCKFKTGLLDGACHGSTRLDKLPECGLNPSSDRYSPGESVCLITRTDSGGCAGIVHAVECLAVAAAIKANEAVKTEASSSLGASLRDWQDYRGCAPCTDSLFDAGSECDVSAGSSTGSSTALGAVEQQSKDLLTSYVYGIGVDTTLAKTDEFVDFLYNHRSELNRKKGRIAKALLTRFTDEVLKKQELQGALFNRGKDGLLPPLGYPYPTTDNDRPPCANSTHNTWNLSSSSSLDAFMLQYVVGEWTAFLVDYESLWDSEVDVEYLRDRLRHFQKYIKDNPENIVIATASKSQLHGRLLEHYNEYVRRAAEGSDQPLEACFDLSPLTPGCRVPFNGWLSHRPRNGTERTLLNMRTDIQVHGLSPPHDLKDGDFRWRPEPTPGTSEGSEPDSIPWGSTAPPLAQAYHEATPDSIECGFTRETPHVELVITEMWPDQQNFIEEFERLFGKDSLDWWGLTCDASELVSKCAGRDDETGYGDNVSESCKQNWSVEDCRRRLTELQGLRYLPDLHHQDAIEDEIRRRNQERVPCTVPDPMDGELDIQCPWQPSRVGYSRIAAVAVWGIKHCVNQAARLECDHTDPVSVPYGELSTVTVSEPLGLVVYSANSEGRSVALQDNLSLGG